MLKFRYLSALVGMALATAASAESRLDGALRLASSHPERAAHLLHLPARIATETRVAAVGVQTVPTLLRFEGAGLDKVKAAGLSVRSVSGNIATVDIPAVRLKEIAALPGVVYIEAARRLRAKLDVSVPATHADRLRYSQGANFTGLTGKGVIVGIVDDGVDFRHQDFRNTDGSTRILQLWDMRKRGAAGSPPSGFSYGGVCTAAMINSAINGNSSACSEASNGGHGTHVAGIAAGNGQATGNGQSAYRMVGMAPQADIVAANPLGNGVTASDAVMDGVNYVKQVAQSLGKPAVVNLSLGSYYGPRDGTSNYEQALSNAVAPGFFIAGAVGNEADAPIRATGTIARGQTVSIGYNIPDGTQDNYVEMWYPGTQTFTVRVQGPTGSGADCDSGNVTVGSDGPSVSTSCGTISVSSSDTMANNDDRQIFIALTTDSGKVTEGNWTISLTATALPTASTTFSMIGGEEAGGPSFTNFTDATTTQIITDTASATNVIGVAAYVTKEAWNSIDGHKYQYQGIGDVGDIAAFSSRGPRRDCSNLAKCPRTMKPEIAAPGAAIVSALAQDDTSVPQTDIDPDGVHTVKAGTSMATPHVTGAIALLLQQNPQLTLAALRSALFGHVQVNAYTSASGLPTYAQQLLPTNPNYTWGYGILDVEQAQHAAAAFGVANPSFVLHRTLSTGQVDYSATVTPITADADSVTNVYIAAQIGSNLFLRNGNNWQLYDGVNVPAAAAVTSGTTFDIDIATLPNTVNASLLGTQLYVGYGKSATEMLNGKFAVVGQIK